MTETVDDLLEFAEGEGYLAARMVDGKAVCLIQFMFTCAIAVIDKTSVLDRWCYHTGVDAMLALADWEKKGYVGEPEGWHRHPYSGRRRDENGKEWVNP